MNSIYQVYTWYIPCINLSYDNVKYIPDIHLLKLSATFWYLSRDGLDPIYTKYKLGIYLVYTMTKLSRDRYQNVAESFSRCMSGIYFTLSYDRFMHGIYQVYIYTWYILFSISIYQEYTWYMTFLLYSRYMTSIYLVAGAVEEDMAPCRQSHRQSHHRIHHPCTFYFCPCECALPF